MNDFGFETNSGISTCLVLSLSSLLAMYFLQWRREEVGILVGGVRNVPALITLGVVGILVVISIIVMIYNDPNIRLKRDQTKLAIDQQRAKEANALASYYTDMLTADQDRINADNAMIAARNNFETALQA